MKNLTPAKVTLIMFVVVGGLVIAYVAKGLLATDEVVKTIERRNLPMAISDLEPGTIITESHIGLGPVLVSELKAEMLLTNRVIVGRVVKERIPKATPILAQQLYQPGERPPLEVSEGHRAISINVGDSVALVDGLIKPGQFVDVHFTPDGYRSDPRIRGGMTMTLFEGVKILAINQSFSQVDVSRGGNTITFEMTPQQANIAILAQSAGTMTMTFNPNGPGSGGIALEREDRATLEEILGLRPVPKEEPPFTVEVFRRGAFDTLEFRDNHRIHGGSRGRQRNPVPSIQNDDPTSTTTDSDLTDPADPTPTATGPEAADQTQGLQASNSRPLRR